MSNRLGFVAIGLAAAAIGVSLLRPRSQSPAAGDQSDRMRALEARVALLERQARQARAFPAASEVSGRLVVPVAPGADADAPAPTARTHALPSPVDEVAIQREYFGDLDVRLASESRDPVWSAATEEKLRGSAHELRPRITVDKAQCGETMCRVEATVPEPREDVAAVNKFLAVSLHEMPEAMVRDGDGPGRHVVYFARQGSGFPPMNAAEGAAQ
jgi:hypothetical protein